MTNPQKTRRCWLERGNARPDITMRLPRIDLSMLYVLQTASGQILLILNKASAKLNLERCPLTTWAFIANITKFIL
jgi:hypothetical protein